MTVLFCANPGYFQHLAAAARSVADTSPGSAVDFHVLTCDSDAEAERKLRDSLSDDRLSLTIHRVGDARLNDFFVDKFMSKECYLRIFAPEVLSSDLDRVLYLDCDLVVLDDLRPLWESALGGKAVGAAPDYPRLPSVISPTRRRQLGIPLDQVYVNSGVLLIDLVRWRKLGLTRRILDYVETMGPALEFYDQDAINAVLSDELFLLDCRWNLQARMYACGRQAFPLEFEATREARRRPAILHYTGSEKPWLFRSRIPRKGDYFAALSRTQWAGALPRVQGSAQRLEFRFGRMLALMGFDYMQAAHYLRRLGGLVTRRTARRVTGSGPRPAP
ncbi:glycosyltransferase family 8 protein [Paracoccus sp. S-4012]|uniref:glycosyltransferase family 8 protein n=1 Tax=Paracoccus sp. S-4012 TaxID=2665648 RepID=UPI0012B1314C|nr:glycosyltransferase family 8 protein [Paracoccus sp. S-4012]MRX51924.1 glycosyltransferase family 8 protein [Paracoccus sp. S-4012]